jgi:hypothetical protein
MTQLAVQEERIESPPVIAGCVYKDEDGDGAYTPATDISIPGATVSAWRDGSLVAASIADKNGQYALSVPPAEGYTLRASLPSSKPSYDPVPKAWGRWSTIEGEAAGVHSSARNLDLSVSYRMLNYGPRDLSWELWHEGPVFDRDNVILVHGYEMLSFFTKGRCDHAFGQLDRLLQTRENQYNVWQFEYTDRYWGTPHAVETYAPRLGGAVNRISRLTGRYACSIVAYSMGGIIARKYMAMGGKPRVDKLLTLATPHMGTTHYAPFDLELVGRLYPRAAVELRPASRTLWDLNTDLDSSLPGEFAAIGGYSRGHEDGLIEIAATSPTSSNADGAVSKRHYFAGVNRTHTGIKDITGADDEVFQLVRDFLRGGVANLASARTGEHPRDYDAHPFLTFALKTTSPWLRMVYPLVVVTNTGRRYSGFKAFSIGDRTADGSRIFTVQLKPDDEGEVRIYYAPGRYQTICVSKSQPAIVADPIGADVRSRPVLSPEIA